MQTLLYHSLWGWSLYTSSPVLLRFYGEATLTEGAAHPAGCLFSYVQTVMLQAETGLF